MTVAQTVYKPRIHYSLIYVLSFLFALHSFLVIYVNSTYISQFMTEAIVGTLFIIGSSLAVFSFLFISNILRRVGNVRLTVYLALTELIALVTLGLTTEASVAITALVVFLVVNPLLFLNLDIFSETLIGDQENTTGYKRGLALALMSTTGVIGPLLLGPLIGSGEAENLQNVYLASAAIFAIFILIVLQRFRPFKDPAYSEVRVLDAIRSFWEDRNIRFSLSGQFILQLCFSWMVIYVPLYLSTVIGLSWGEIGLIIAVGILAYVLLEFPIGYIADNYIGEQEMMILGYVIMSAGVVTIAILDSANLWAWMALMFGIRIGASLVETTTESYFFKHTKGDDTNYLSFFRLTRPLAVIFGALLGSASLLYLSFDVAFYVLAAIVLLGVVFAARIEDTK